MLRNLIQWAHLGIVVLVVAGISVSQAVIRFVYRFFPFKSALDGLWLNGRVLRRYFAFRLGEDESRRTAKTAKLQLSAREMVERAGYGFEEHAVTTADGYVLGLQRIIAVEDEGEEDDDGEDNDGGDSTVLSTVRSTAAAAARVSGAKRSSGRSLRNSGRPPVLLQHGLMQCSEAWLVGDKTRSLAFYLAEAGFDVWLGNVRGNKFSQQHLHLPVESNEFWDFSLDQFARFDLPAMVDHILGHVSGGFAKVGYVGFSQGTAMAGAALSLHSSLNSKLSCFVALSPAMAVKGLAKSPVTALVESDLSFINLLFGRRRMLPLTVDVQKSLSSQAWVSMIDASLIYLFGWKAENIDPAFKQLAYHHLYSFTSVKAVLHWFQMISSGRLALYQAASQGLSSPLSSIPIIGPILTALLPTGAGGLPFVGSSVSAATVMKHAVPTAFDVKKVAVPIACFAGGADTIIDIPKLLTLLPPLSGRVPMPHNYLPSRTFNAALAEAIVAASAGHSLSAPPPPPPYSPESSPFRGVPGPISTDSRDSGAEHAAGSSGTGDDESQFRLSSSSGSASTTDKSAYRDFTLLPAPMPATAIAAATGQQGRAQDGSNRRGGSSSLDVAAATSAAIEGAAGRDHSLLESRKRSGSTLQFLAAAVHDAVGGYAGEEDALPEHPTAQQLRDAALHPGDYLTQHQHHTGPHSRAQGRDHGHGSDSDHGPHSHGRRPSSTVLVTGTSLGSLAAQRHRQGHKPQQAGQQWRSGAFGFLSQPSSGSTTLSAAGDADVLVTAREGGRPTPTANTASTSTSTRMVRAAVAQRIDQYLEGPSWPATAFRLPSQQPHEDEAGGGALDTSIVSTGQYSQLTSASAMPTRQAAGASGSPASSPLYRYERQECFVHIEAGFEHLDTMWSGKAAAAIFPAVATVLQRYVHTQYLHSDDDVDHQQQSYHHNAGRRSRHSFNPDGSPSSGSYGGGNGGGSGGGGAGGAYRRGGGAGGGGGGRHNSSRDDRFDYDSQGPRDDVAGEDRGDGNGGRGGSSDVQEKHHRLHHSGATAPRGERSVEGPDSSSSPFASPSSFNGAAMDATSSSAVIAKNISHGPDVGASPGTDVLRVQSKSRQHSSGAEADAHAPESDDDDDGVQHRGISGSVTASLGASFFPELPASRGPSRGNSFSSPSHAMFANSSNSTQHPPPPPPLSSSVGAALMLSTRVTSSSSSSSATATATPSAAAVSPPAQKPVAVLAALPASEERLNRSLASSLDGGYVLRGPLPGHTAPSLSALLSSVNRNLGALSSDVAQMAARRAAAQQSAASSMGLDAGRGGIMTAATKSASSGLSEASEAKPAVFDAGHSGTASNANSPSSLITLSSPSSAGIRTLERVVGGSESAVSPGKQRAIAAAAAFEPSLISSSSNVSYGGLAGPYEDPSSSSSSSVVSSADNITDAAPASTLPLPSSSTAPPSSAPLPSAAGPVVSVAAKQAVSRAFLNSALGKKGSVHTAGSAAASAGSRQASAAAAAPALHK